LSQTRLSCGGRRTDVRARPERQIIAFVPCGVVGGGGSVAKKNMIL